MTASAAIAASTHVGQAPSIKDRIRAILDQAELSRPESWIRRTYRDYASLTIDLPLGMFVVTRLALNSVERKRIAEDPALAYMLAYADPTGEAAIRNLMRGPR